MLRAFPIGRLFGIRLDVHTSWLPVYALIVATLAHVGPLAALGTVPAYALAAAGALALFASVVAHELAHALTARRFGVQTASITLFLFGGIAMLEDEPPTPAADAFVAAAGPAISAVLAASAYGAMHLVDAVVPFRFTDAAASLLAYVTYVNALLCGFNLIPAYPMDGGRILRAGLWALRRDRDDATIAASYVGLIFGVALGVAGIAAAIALRTWQFAWFPVVAAYLVRSCLVQIRALRRARMTVTVRSTRSASGAVSVAVRTASQSS